MENLFRTFNLIRGISQIRMMEGNNKSGTRILLYIASRSFQKNLTVNFVHSHWLNNFLIFIHRNDKILLALFGRIGAMISFCNSVF